jgi:hypothetical protein
MGRVVAGGAWVDIWAVAEFMPAIKLNIQQNDATLPIILMIFTFILSSFPSQAPAPTANLIFPPAGTSLVMTQAWHNGLSRGQGVVCFARRNV